MLLINIFQWHKSIYYQGNSRAVMEVFGTSWPLDFATADSLIALTCVYVLTLEEVYE